MDSDSIRQIIILIVLLCLSAFFSASETSFTSLSKMRLKSLIDNGDKKAKKVEKVGRDSDRFLTTILIGNNLANTALSSIATAIALSIAGGSDWALSVATVIATIMILIFGEITPKTVAAKNAENIAKALATPLSVLLIIFKPVVFLLNKVTGFFARLLGVRDGGSKATITESELKTIVDVSQEEGIIEAGEHEIISNVFDFSDSRARDVMTPRTEIVALPVTATYKEVLEMYREERFSRMPIYREDLDHIVGVLHFKDFMLSDCTEKDFRLEHYMRDPIFSYESKLTLELMAQMRQANSSIAVILDEYGGTSGIITFEDLVEELVGDIYDEYEDTDDEIFHISENEYLVDGLTKIDDFNELAGAKLESEDYETLGGYAMGMFGRIPKIGETLDQESITITIEEMDRNRIDKLRIIVK